MLNEYELISKLLFEKYNKIALNSVETAEIIGTSKKALELDRYTSQGIPYIRRTEKERSQVLYSVTSIAKFLVDNQIKIS